MYAENQWDKHVDQGKQYPEYTAPIQLKYVISKS